MSSAIETHSTLDSFFAELLSTALDAERLELDADGIAYIIGLFREFGHSDALYRCTERDEPGTPALVWLVEQAERSDPNTRFSLYRHLGDVALWVAGLFGPHIERERSLVGLDYYVKMGTSAYDTAANLSRSGGVHQVLRELASKFERLIEVLTRVAEQANLPTPNRIADLCERFWLTPDSSRVQEALIRQGAIPMFASRGKIRCAG